MTIAKLEEEILENREWLQTTEGDEVECISLENLETILANFTGAEIKLYI